MVAHFCFISRIDFRTISSTESTSTESTALSPIHVWGRRGSMTSCLQEVSPKIPFAFASCFRRFEYRIAKALLTETSIRSVWQRRCERWNDPSGYGEEVYVFRMSFLACLMGSNLDSSYIDVNSLSFVPELSLYCIRATLLHFY